ncbi:MAG: hypothetical protein Q9174_006684 [Haloplaca sp. 1 TL-2023]
MASFLVRADDIDHQYQRERDKDFWSQRERDIELRRRFPTPRAATEDQYGARPSSELEKRVHDEILDEYHETFKGTLKQILKEIWSYAIFRLNHPDWPSLPSNPYRGREYFYNKSTAFYWAQTAYWHDEIGFSPAVHPICACIYKEWFRCHGGKPNISHHDRYFAAPVRLGEGGPSTIADILEAHRSLCCQLDSPLQERTRDHEDGYDTQASSSSQCENTANPNNTLLPLFRAAILIFDRLGPIIRFQDTEDLIVPLDHEALHQNVLLVLTGDNDGLSAPIDFTSVPSCEVLPTARPNDPLSQELRQRVLRVPLRTAVKFIADMQRREDSFAKPALTNEQSEQLALASQEPWEWKHIDILSRHNPLNNDEAKKQWLRYKLEQRKGTIWKDVQELIDSEARGEKVWYFTHPFNLHWI